MFNNSTPFSMPVVPAGTSGGGLGGFGDSWVGLIIILALLGWGGNGLGFGGFGGGGSGLQGMATRADINEGFALNNITGGIQAIQHGICDSTYALNGTITNGIHGLQAQLAECCCGTQRAIDGVRYDMATQACDTRNLIQNTTRDIIENANNNNRALLDFLVQDKISTLQSENQSLKLAASQANQNAVLQAAMDANTAEIIRRTGNDCPIPAYVVQPPAQVTFPVNSCGTFTGYGGCGCA